MAGSRPPAPAAPAGHATGAPASETRPGWLRWHAWLGAVPLAGYVLLHVGAQVLALRAGPEQRALEAAWERAPLWDGVVLVCVLLPLLAHVALGSRRLADPGADPYWPAPLGRSLQRASALVLLAFLCAHVWQLSGRRWLGELQRADYLAELCGSLSSTALGGVPLVAIGYLLGMAAAALHLAQGLYHAGCSTGLLGEQRRRWLGNICWLCGVGVFTVGALVIVRLATGSLSLGLSGVPGPAPGTS